MRWIVASEQSSSSPATASADALEPDTMTESGRRKFSRRYDTTRSCVSR